MTTAPAQEKRAPYLPPRRAAPPPGLNPWLIRLPLLLATGLFLLGVLLAGLVAAFQIKYAGRITPGVSAYGIDLSGMTEDEALAALAARFRYDDEAVFTFRDGDRLWTMTAGELGVSFDAASTVEEAMNAGGDDNFASRLVHQAIAWFNGKAITPVIRYDQGVAVARLNEIAAAINRPAQNAVLNIDGTTVTTSPSATGRTLDVTATLARLDQFVLSLTSGAEVPLVINETPPVVWNVDEAAARVRAALSGPLELTASGSNGEALGPWTASVEQILSLLVVELADNGDGTYSYDVNVNFSALSTFLEDLAPGLVTQPRDGRFHFDDATRQLQVIRPSAPGRSLNVAQTLARFEEAVFRYDSRVVPMAFDFIEPRYHDGITAAELGISEMVAEATTLYAGSTANRIHNITEGASRFDGLIIGPGEEFSFNYWLGDVSEASGFVESKVILGEQTTDGVGGGICQVSTTAFRAAFNGGFRIIERHAHAYRVGFYEQNAGPGLDAAIWTPDQDFRFQNDTPYHLLIEVSVYPASSSLQFRFYSTNPGRQVHIDQPIVRDIVAAPATRYVVNNDLLPGQYQQVDWAAEGADVYVRRTIRDAHGNLLSQEDLFTHYAAWGAVIEVPPGDPRASPGG